MRRLRRRLLPQRPDSRVAAGALALVLLALPCCARASWTILVQGTDQTRLAAPIEHDGGPAVNLTALAATLGIQVQVAGNEALLVDTTGTQWRAQNGALSLEAPGRSLPLRFPMLIQGGAVFLPLETIANLARLRLDVDATAQKATLGAPQVSATPDAPPASAQDAAGSGDLQTFTVEKKPEEKAQDAQDADNGLAGRSGSARLNLPPTSDTFRLGLGMGYVQGYDAGLELTGSGKAWGTNVNFSTLLTGGPHGFQARGASLSLRDEEGGHELDFGPLPDELRGSAVGARYAWRAGADRWPSLSVYLGSSGSGYNHTVLAYRDGITLAPHVRVSGEVASDGSFYIQSGLQGRRMSLFGYSRFMADRTQSGWGALFSVDVGKGIGLYGSLTQSGAGTTLSRYSNIAIRFPLRRGIDLTLEHTQTSALNAQNSSNAATVSVPIGPLRLLARYQLGNAQILPVAQGLPLTQIVAQPLWLQTGHRNLMFGVTYGNAKGFNLNYQANIAWQQDNHPAMSQQMISSFRLSDRAQLQLINAFPQILDPSQSRLRLNYALSQGLALSLDYGLISTYQSEAIRPGERGLMVMLRSHWDVATPRRGGQVGGQVTDQLGHPLRDVIVRLNSYQARTDAKGRYLFRPVPPGDYVLSLDKESVPADYKAADGEKRLVITGSSRKTVDLRVIPLHTLIGRVYCDKNGNGTYDPGEGVGQVVLMLNDMATATASDGSFAFYNVEPGKPTIRLDAGRLSADYAPASPLEVTSELTPDGSVSDITFRLVKQEKAILFQQLP